MKTITGPVKADKTIHFLASKGKKVETADKRPMGTDIFLKAWKSVQNLFYRRDAEAKAKVS